MRALSVLALAVAVLVAGAQSSTASTERFGAAGAAADAPGGSGWDATATAFRGTNGSRYVYTCPSYGAAYSVWGTDVYTDDSSVCTAAVHTGSITLAGGGVVTIEIRPGQDSYSGTTRNGITSANWGSWSGSFVIVAATPAPPGLGIGGASWDAKATAFRAYIGARFVYTCPPNGTPYTIWGTSTYTDDSSVCTAAVHVGLITLAAGGSVTIEMRAGQTAYQGSTRNGVTSSAYGTWDASFVFPAALGGGGAGTIGSPNPPPPPQASVSVNVGDATGTVLVKLAGQSGFATLQGNAQIPVGAEVDATKGSVALTSAEGTATFKQGAFVVREPRAPAATRVTNLVLAGGSFAQCPKAKRKTSSATLGPKSVVRHLWGSGKGHFQTTGRFASATVRGTHWHIEDRCDGTWTQVVTGVVAVRDFKRRQTVLVTAGHTYIAHR